MSHHYNNHLFPRILPHRVISLVILLILIIAKSCGLQHILRIQRKRHLLSLSHTNYQSTSIRRKMQNSDMDRWGEEQGVGVNRWNALREQWLNESKELQQQSDNDAKKQQDYVDVDTVVEYLIHPKRPPFPKPVPLPEIVDILIELWEAEYTTL